MQRLSPSQDSSPAAAVTAIDMDLRPRLASQAAVATVHVDMHSVRGPWWRVIKDWVCPLHLHLGCSGMGYKLLQLTAPKWSGGGALEENLGGGLGPYVVHDRAASTAPPPAHAAPHPRNLTEVRYIYTAMHTAFFFFLSGLLCACADLLPGAALGVFLGIQRNTQDFDKPLKFYIKYVIFFIKQ